ncbi:hypothetical protein DMENIID0001_113380 [Sergentomyia squamirostris]
MSSLPASTGVVPAIQQPSKTFNSVIKTNFLNDLRFGHLNCRSLRGCVDEICETWYSLGLLVLALSETWLDDRDIIPEVDGPNGFKIVRCDRAGGRRGGGVGFILSNALETRLVASGAVGDVEFVSIEINLPYFLLFVYAVYIPPAVSNTDSFNSFLNTIDLNANFILLGDLNINLMSNSVATRDFKDLLSSLSLYCVPFQPTRFDALLDYSIIPDRMRALIMSSQQISLPGILMELLCLSLLRIFGACVGMTSDSCPTLLYVLTSSMTSSWGCLIGRFRSGGECTLTAALLG